MTGNIVVSGGPSLQFVPDNPTTAMLLEVALFGPRPEVLLQGVAARAGHRRGLGLCKIAAAL